jgi:sugar phosphate isomerase/epimerase
MNRRNFIKNTAAGGLVSSIEVPIFAKDFVPDPKTKLKVMATNWGWTGSIDAFCAAIKKSGYDGLELWWPDNANEQKELFVALEKYNLEIGYLCGGSQKDPVLHLNSFKKALKEASTLSARKPLYINCHSGRDFFSYEQNKAFIDLTTEVSKKTNITIAHETHRSRMLFAAHVTQNFIDKNPDLRLTLDISHWCNVHESLLADQPEAVEKALARTVHLHARVGHEEGPQVNDPRAPEWSGTFKTHLSWWDTVVKRLTQENKTVTILTEFGPPTYLPTLPYTLQPVADQWAINEYMMQFLRKRYLG